MVPAGCGGRASSPSKAGVPSAVVVPWQQARWPARPLAGFAGAVRRGNTPWCRPSDLHVRVSRFQVVQQSQLVSKLLVRDVESRPCGVQGYPTAVALGANGSPVGSSVIEGPGSFELHPWLRLRPHGAPAEAGISTADEVAQCRMPVVTAFAIRIRGRDVGDVAAPSNAGCGPTRRTGRYVAMVGYWIRRSAPAFNADEGLRMSLTSVQRHVDAGGIEHFAITFTGADVRALLHPCLPVIITLSPDGPPVTSQRRTLLNCSAVPDRSLRSITFRMELPVPRNAPDSLDVDVICPLPISGTYDALGDGQYLPIEVRST